MAIDPAEEDRAAVYRARKTTPIVVVRPRSANIGTAIYDPASVIIPGLLLPGETTPRTPRDAA